MPEARNPFGTRGRIEVSGERVGLFRLDVLERAGVARALHRLPISIKLLLESALRQCGASAISEEEVARIAGWTPKPAELEVPFLPARVVMPDYTGCAILADLAAMRAAVHRAGGDAARVNPLVPVDLVVDHSIHVDVHGRPDAAERNAELEMRRNRERYEFIRWAQRSMRNFRAVPPGRGIVHQVNLEFLAYGILVGRDEHGEFAYLDSVLGADSHTPMINALGILGWGVGGIEVEAAMLGQPLYFRLPRVVGVKLEGSLAPGATATDLALTVTELLRRHGVVDAFVEYFGPGVSTLALNERSTVANMAPEYGATVGVFPLDHEALDYLRRTGRPGRDVALLERYAREQGLFREEGAPEPVFSELLTVELSRIEPSVAGPRRPQDRMSLGEVKPRFLSGLSAPVKEDGFEVPEARRDRQVELTIGGRTSLLGHGAIVLAALTSCTNTSNPAVMIAAGLVARRAVARGLQVPAHVKTSLGPGSRAVSGYLKKAGLLSHLEALGFHVIGYGCTSCIGNSGPLEEAVARAISAERLVVAAVLSGNRNFEARIHPLVRANYLASPPLVVALAIAGRIDFDPEAEPLGTGIDGRPVFLRDLWPTPEELAERVRSAVTPEVFEEAYRDAFDGSPEWRELGAGAELLFPWEPGSTFVQEPPFFAELSRQPAALSPILGARVLVRLGDSITTDHIAPAGEIPLDSAAGRLLTARGVRQAEFNTYASRRGSHEVSMRGIFVSARLRNQLVPGVEGGVTLHLPSSERMSIFEASERYAREATPLVVLAGREYGTGSSRDWAAKGPRLLGIRAVLAESFERIHRANLVAMGVLPLQFLPGDSAAALGLSGLERFDVLVDGGSLEARGRVEVRARGDDGRERTFGMVARVESEAELDYLRHGGVLPMIARRLLATAP
ncbi:MAG: aconitate hydratase AcnA [Myxococcaceae bacterium]|nr:aconitate hydratase AcnA [Myxococcaceae bacterium]